MVLDTQKTRIPPHGRESVVVIWATAIFHSGVLIPQIGCLKGSVTQYTVKRKGQKSSSLPTFSLLQNAKDPFWFGQGKSKLQCVSFLALCYQYVFWCVWHFINLNFFALSQPQSINCLVIHDSLLQMSKNTFNKRVT